MGRYNPEEKNWVLGQEAMGVCNALCPKTQHTGFLHLLSSILPNWKEYKERLDRFDFG
jgi:hypothetical protein